MIGRLGAWPPASVTLTGDHAYDIPARDLDGDRAVPAGFEGDTRSFVKNHWLLWRNTNLRKYLDMRLQEARG